jgi:hypothetical protein
MSPCGNSLGAKLQWGTVNSNSPYFGFALDQSDGTFVWSLKGTNYASGLAIGGGSGNLLWKGNVVSTNGHTHTKANITDFTHTHTYSDISNINTY